MNKQRQGRQRPGHGVRSLGLTLGIIALAAIALWGGTGLLLRMAARPAGPHLKPYVTPALDARGTRVQFQGPSGWKLTPIPIKAGFTGGHDPATAAFVLTPPYPLAGLPVRLRRWVPRWWLPNAEPRASLLVSIGPLSSARRPGWPGLYDGKVVTSRMLIRPINDPTRLLRQLHAQRGVLLPDRRYWLHVSYHRENEAAFDATYAPICRSVRLVGPVP